MTVALLIVFGLALGSFVNALIWRIHKQGEKKKQKTKVGGRNVNLSIVNGRSVCVHCGHELAAKDLVPLLSWLSLRGKCRYCKKKIEDTPVSEVLTAALFVLSYLYWPYELTEVIDWLALSAWLAVVVGLVALVLYDFKHYILPNRIVFPLMGVAVALRVFLLFGEGDELDAVALDIVTGVLVGGGFFYLLFQVSQGRWIGGGDVKLGFLMGIILGPLGALIANLSAFYIAAFVILPLMLIGKVSRKSRIPFGPFLIAGLVLSFLWSEHIIDAYNSVFGL